MGFILKIALVGLFLLLLFTQCSRKKTAAPNLPDWLENHFPGRFQVLSTQADDAIRNLSLKMKKSVVAEAADTMVQSLVRWDARQPDLKLTTEGVKAQFERAAEEWKDAQSFYKILKMNGFENISISVRDGEAVILAFEEPKPERRHELLFQLEKAHADWPQANNYDKELVFMDTVGGGNVVGDFVPLTFWMREEVTYRKKMLFSVGCKYNEPFSAAALEQAWMFNTDSDRFSVFYEKVRVELEKWTAIHFKKKITPEFELVEVGQSGPSPILLQFKIPASENPSESGDSVQSPNGYFMVDFDVDAQGVSKISHTNLSPEEE